MSKMSISKFIKVLNKNLPKLEVKTNESFKNHTTFGVGGKIKAFVEVKDELTLLSLLKLCKKHNVDYFILGNGSNLLVQDKVFLRLVIKISLNYLSAKGEYLTAGGGVNMFALNQFAISQGLSGLEWSYGIPGSVGGAVKMNAGSFGGEIKDVVDKVYFTDGNKIYFKHNKNLLFSYRNSYFSNNNYVIIKVVFRLKKGESQTIQNNCLTYFGKRLKMQPYGQKSAGSVFKRPEGNFAPVLIEKCNLKGYKCGGAEVSKIHCGFIVNNNNAKFSDIFKIICKIKKTVYKKFGIILDEEIKILID